jgi:hypothetical protein
MPRKVFMVRCGVGGDRDEAAGRGGPSAPGSDVVVDAGGADVVGEHLAELVVADLADVRDPAAEARRCRRSVLAAEPPDVSMPGGIAA